MCPIIVDLDYYPEKDIVLLLRLKSRRNINIIESIAEILTHSIGILCKHGYVKIFEIYGNSVKVAIDSVLIEHGNIARLMSVLNRVVSTVIDPAGNIRIEDLSIPPSGLEYFKGPFNGVEGVRKILSVFDRPLIALKSYDTTIELNLVDILLEDSLLSRERFSTEFKRIVSRTLYIADLSALWNNMERSMRYLQDLGVGGIAVDISCIGWPFLSRLRELAEEFNLLLYAYGSHWMGNRISERVYIYLLRLMGFDLINIGPLMSLSSYRLTQLRYLADICRRTSLRERPSARMLSKNFSNIKPAMPAVDYKLDPNLMSKIPRFLEQDVVLVLNEAVVSLEEINEKLRAIKLALEIIEEHSGSSSSKRVSL